MLGKSVTREGTLLMKAGEVYLDGWEIAEGGMCREVAILACHYAARRLLDYAMRMTLEGGSAPVCSDLPPETPKEWLCPRTREFDAMFEAASSDNTMESQMIDYEQKYKRLIVAIAKLSEDCLSSEGVYPWRWTDEETGKVIAEAIAEAASLQPTSVGESVDQV